MLLSSLMLVIVFLMVPIFEENASVTWFYFAFVLLGLITALLRTYLTSNVTHRTLWIPYWLLLVQHTFILASTLFIGGPKGSGHKSIINRSHSIVTLFMYVIVLLAHGIVSWLHSIPMSLSLLGVSAITSYYSQFDGKWNFMMVRSSIAASGAIIFAAYCHEKHRKIVFTTEKVAHGVAELLENDMESHKKLLDKLVPQYVIPNVISKILIECDCLVQHIPDCVILALRIPSPPRHQHMDEEEDEGASSYVFLRENFRAVEKTLLSLQAEASHCSVFHVLGDVMLVGGPMLDIKTPKPQLHKSEVEMVQGVGGQHYKKHRIQEHAAGKCATLLVSIVACLEKSFSGHLTATMAYGNGYGAVLGEYLPSFDLVGSACRTAQEMLDAAPSGFLGCTEGFLRFLECVQGRPDWVTLGIREAVDEATSWRLRGAGQVRVVPLKSTK